jgi:hypothetical protein
MTHQLLLTDIDISKAKQEIENKLYLWSLHTERQSSPLSAHQQTETIYLQGPLQFTYDAFINSLDSFKYIEADLLPHCMDLVNQVIKYLKPKEIGRVVIVNLKANGKVNKHIDQGKYPEHYERYHLAIKSNDKCISYSNEMPFIMQEGELWKYAHRIPHYAVNNSNEDRWNLIFDCAY